MSDKLRVYLDACCFIDMAASQLEVTVQAWKEPHIFYCRKFLEAARAQDIVVHTSVLTVAECTYVNEQPDGVQKQIILNDEVKALFKGMLLSGKSGVMPVQATPSIVERARDLRWVHGAPTKPMDAIHVATALAMKCTHFVTTDILQGIEIIRGLGLSVGSADSIAHLLPSIYRQLPLTPAAKLTVSLAADAQA